MANENNQEPVKPRKQYDGFCRYCDEPDSEWSNEDLRKGYRMTIDIERGSATKQYHCYAAYCD